MLIYFFFLKPWHKIEMTPENILFFSRLTTGLSSPYRVLWFVTQEHFLPITNYQQKESLILIINQYIWLHNTESVS